MRGYGFTGSFEILEQEDGSWSRSNTFELLDLEKFPAEALVAFENSLEELREKVAARAMLSAMPNDAGSIERASGSIDPFDERYHDRELFVVYGHDCFPSLMKAKVLTEKHGVQHIDDGPTIWGYSVHEGEPGFRTVGMGLQEWIDGEEQDGTPRFFPSFELMVRHLGELLSPSAGAVAPPAPEIQAPPCSAAPPTEEAPPWTPPWDTTVAFEFLDEQQELTPQGWEVLKSAAQRELERLKREHSGVPEANGPTAYLDFLKGHEFWSAAQAQAGQSAWKACEDQPVYQKDPDGGPDFCRTCGLPCTLHKEAEALLVEHGKELGLKAAIEALRDAPDDDFEVMFKQNRGEAAARVVRRLLDDLESSEELWYQKGLDHSVAALRNHGFEAAAAFLSDGKMPEGAPPVVHAPGPGGCQIGFTDYDTGEPWCVLPNGHDGPCSHLEVKNGEDPEAVARAKEGQDAFIAGLKNGKTRAAFYEIVGKLELDDEQTRMLDAVLAEAFGNAPCSDYVPDSYEGTSCGNCGSDHPDADVEAWLEKNGRAGSGRAAGGMVIVRCPPLKIETSPEKCRCGRVLELACSRCDGGQG